MCLIEEELCSLKRRFQTFLLYEAPYDLKLYFSEREQVFLRGNMQEVVLVSGKLHKELGLILYR